MSRHAIIPASFQSKLTCNFIRFSSKLHIQCRWLAAAAAVAAARDIIGHLRRCCYDRLKFAGEKNRKAQMQFLCNHDPRFVWRESVIESRNSPSSLISEIIGRYSNRRTNGPRDLRGSAVIAARKK